MDRDRNPYSPGAGVPPHAFAGRDDEMALWRSVLSRGGANRPDRGLVIHGLRGVGKTVLLGAMREEAESRDWIVAQIEAGADDRDFRMLLGERLYPAMRRQVKPGLGARMRRALSTFASFSVQVDAQGTWSLGVALDPSPPPTGNLELDLITLATDLAEAMREERHGVAILIDEMQELDGTTLGALCAVAHHASQRTLPFFVCGAGLPSLPRLLVTVQVLGAAH